MKLFICSKYLHIYTRCKRKNSKVRKPHSDINWEKVIFFTSFHNMNLKMCGPIRGRPTRCCEETRQCTYDVTPRRCVQPLLQWKSNTYYIFWVCVCSLGYPECKAHAPIRKCHLGPVWLWHIFSALSHKRHDFRGKNIEQVMYVLNFSTISVWNISYSKKNSARCYRRFLQVSL